MRNDFESNYLMHHGILGMKWGKRNGPPYPLGSGDHSANERREGWRKSLGSGKNEHLYDRNQTNSKSHRSTTKASSNGGSSHNSQESLKSTIKQIVNKRDKDTQEKVKSTNESKSVPVETKEHTSVYNKYVDYQANRYKEKFGLDDATAKQKAQENAELMKKVLIGTGVAVGVAAGTAALVYAGRNYMGYTIKAGTKLQTLAKDPKRLEKGIQFYTSFIKSDQRTYLGMFGKGKSGEKLLKYKINTGTLDDLKIPSRVESEKMFKEIFSRPESQQQLLSIKRDIMRDINDAAVDKGLTKEVITQSRKVSEAIDDILSGKIDYNHYNKHILPLDDARVVTKYGERLNNIFKQGTLEKGFDGVLDVNDSQKARWLRSLRPTIVFNKEKVDIANATARQVTNMEHYGNLPGAWAKSSMLKMLQTPGNAITAMAVKGAVDAAIIELAFDEKVRREAQNKKSSRK